MGKISRRPESNVHTSLKDSPIFETKFLFSQNKIAIVKRNGSSQRLRVGCASTHGSCIGAQGRLPIPGSAKNSCNETGSLICLINRDAILGDNKVQTKESRDNAKRVNCPVFFKDSDDIMVGSLICTHTEKIISSTTDNDGSSLEEATVDRRISAVWKKAKVIEDDGFNVFLPLRLASTRP